MPWACPALAARGVGACQGLGGVPGGLSGSGGKGAGWDFARTKPFFVLPFRKFGVGQRLLSKEEGGAFEELA